MRTSKWSLHSIFVTIQYSRYTPLAHTHPEWKCKKAKMENAHFSRWFFNPRQSERSSEQVWMWRILLLGMLFVCLQFIIFFSFLLPSASARSYSFSFAVFQMLCIYVGTRYVPGYVKCDVFVSTLSLRRKHNRRNCGIQCHCQHVFSAFSSSSFSFLFDFHNIYGIFLVIAVVDAVVCVCMCERAACVFLSIYLQITSSMCTESV